MKKTVLLHRGRKNEENFQIVSVNGRSWKIMKGVEVQVPDYVAEVLENAQMMADTARRYVNGWPTERGGAAMGQMTAGQVLARWTTCCPTAIPGNRSAGGCGRRRVSCWRRWSAPTRAGEAAELPDELADAAPLLAPAPYDGLYRHYVEAQIHYANGELERYNNAMALWNNGLMTLRDHWCRGHMPRRQARPAAVLRGGSVCTFRSSTHPGRAG